MESDRAGRAQEPDRTGSGREASRAARTDPDLQTAVRTPERRSAALSAAGVVGLQRAAGNRAVSRVLAKHEAAAGASASTARNQAIAQRLTESSGSATAVDTSQADEAIALLEDLIAAAHDAHQETTQADEGKGVGGTEFVPPPELAEVEGMLRRLVVLRASGTQEEISAAARPIIAAFGGQAAGGGPSPAADVSDVQRAAPAAVAAPALAAAGPPGWVVLGVIAVGALIAAGVGVYMSSRGKGNVADTGIMQEVHDLVAAGAAATVCAALAILMNTAKAAGDTDRMGRIKRTQKAKGCKHSRQSR